MFLNNKIVFLATNWVIRFMEIVLFSGCLSISIKGSDSLQRIELQDQKGMSLKIVQRTALGTQDQWGFWAGCSWFS